MNPNKFLQNLNQSAGQVPTPIPPPATPAPPRRPSPAGSVPDGYDPIQRLADEMSRHSRALESVATRIDRLEGRPQAATLAEWETLLVEARNGVRFTPNSEHTAHSLLPYLLNGLPTADQLRAAASAGAGEIEAAGDAAAQRIEQATARGATRIEGASKSKADKHAGVIGFTSWQSALTVVALLVMMVVLANCQSERQAEKIAQAQQETQAVREFTDWVKTQPDGKRLYEQYYKR